MLLTLDLHELSHDTLAQTYQTAAGKHDKIMIQSWNILNLFLPHPVKTLAMGNAATIINKGERVSSCCSLAHKMQLVLCNRYSAFQSNTACCRCNLSEKDFFENGIVFFKSVRHHKFQMFRCWDFGPAAVLWRRSGGHGLRLTGVNYKPRSDKR